MTTTMRQEINEIPQAVSRLLSDSRESLEQAGAALRKRDPAVLVTIARGSSDHAAHFLKYAVELELGIVVASLGPSLASIYQAPLKLDRAAALAISQSGASPDLVALAKSAVAGGATTISLLNTISSPLAAASDIAIDIQAGPEIAVAATKSFVNSIVAGLSLISAWSDNARLAAAVEALPTHLEKALALDWSSLVEVLKDADSLYMLGRGPTLAIACEAALKCKETSELHAEAYSSAEVLHGPVSLVSANFPIIAFAARDKAEASIAATANGLAAKNASVFLTSSLAKESNHLPFIETGHPLTDALALIVPYYGMVESLSRARGLDPDKPAALKKVTETR
ncbi:SIS domain-containing protein [Agrobacterium vitis]|uniref:SIS domain-containing protein n=1 Tax=Agrobacterium vitis TaxID=373 RepID=UPI0015735873|nr:SIS domain-containing protein [Agrobacterium vitis]NSZ19354.1 SIS domain-containing protein [Agrobacterium vitis]QZO06221.1 SIS domain-containing protein [Agrobacterium vitis]UJL90545.1 SIS domain-containing protein [Agrobacterium vitis]